MVYYIYIKMYPTLVLITFSFQKGERSKSTVGVRAPYIRVVGIQVDTSGAGFTSSASFTLQEEDLFKRMAGSANIYERIAKSIAPSIYGFQDVKKAIACLLFGGRLTFHKEKSNIYIYIKLIIRQW